MCREMVENDVLSRKKYNKNVEIRKISYEYELYNAINNTRDGWRRLMGAIPKNLDDLENNQPINEYKYKLDDMRLIEKEITVDKSRATEILLQEWGTSGRKRPTMEHLLKLLVKLDMFRAADIVAILLGEPKPTRPQKGPAARIDTTLPETKAKNVEPKANQSNNTQLNRDLSSKPSPSDINKLQNLMPIPEPSTTYAQTDDNEEKSALLPCFSKISPRLNSRRLESTDDQSTSSIISNSDEIKWNNNPKTNSNYQHTSPNLSLLNQLDSAQISNSSKYSPNLSIFNRIPSENGNFKSTFPDIFMPQEINSTSGFNIPIHVDMSENLNYQESFPDVSVPLKSSINIVSSNQTSFSQSSDTIPSINTESFNEPLLSFLNPPNDNERQQAHLDECSSVYIPDLSQLNLNHSKWNIVEYSIDDIKDIIKLENRIENGMFGHLFIQNEKVVKQFKDSTKYDVEKEILERCQHQNIVELIGYYQPHLCHIFEPLTGENLANKLEKCINGIDLSFGCRERIKTLFECASALKYLHEVLHVIHLKFCSKNVFLNGDQVKLINFEESRPINDVITPKIDIFDFGIVTFEILTNKNAEDRHNFLKMIEEKGAEMIDLRPSTADLRWTLIANDFLGLGERCTEMDANNRPNMGFIVNYTGNLYENL